MAIMTSTHSSSSRIVVIQTAQAPNLSQAAAQNVVQAIIGGDASNSHQTHSIGHRQSSEVDTEGASSFNIHVPVPSAPSESNLGPLPWHISNRYYDADVHFMVHSLPALTQLPSRPARAQASGDVFSALETIAAGSDLSTSSRSINGEHTSRIEDLVEGAPAVVLVCSNDEPVATHRAMLSSLASSLSGFDLEIALAIGLDAPLTFSDNTGEPLPSSRPANRPSKEDLVVLYAEHGWEYISLSESADDSDDGFGDEIDVVEEGLDDMLAADGELDMSMPPPNASLQEVSAGEAETDGVERVRQALMTYMWPELDRHDDRQQKSTGLGARDASAAPPMPLSSFSDWRDGEEGSDEDSEQDREEATTRDVSAISLNQLPSSFPTLSATAEPTESDEALARAFLARLASGANFDTLIAGATANLGGGALPGPPPGDASWKELEDFLASEDSSWPAPLPSAAPDASSAASGEHPQEATAEKFDDDFADFVSAPSSQDVDAARLDALLSGLDMRDAADDLDSVNALGDDDLLPSEQDILATHRSIFGSAATEALARSRSLATHSSEAASSASASKPVRFDDHVGSFAFGSALSSMQSHAQRVQAISDPRLRQKEAARVAIAISWALGEEADGTGLEADLDDDALVAELRKADPDPLAQRTVPSR